MYLAINMRMPVNQLVTERIGHIAKIESALFLAQFREEHHVQQQVAQLLLDTLHVVVRNGIGQFERLFDRVAAQRIESLFAVPRTVSPQSVHHLQQASRRVQTFIFHTVFANFRTKLGISPEKA